MRRFKQSVNDNSNNFMGFLSGKDQEDIYEKALSLELRPYGKLISSRPYTITELIKFTK